MEHYVKVRAIKKVTHDVLQILTEKPVNFTFIPGQATEVSINKEGWKDEKRPFSFTSLPVNNFLEFTIKIYPNHQGVTNQIWQLRENDELILHDVFGDIAYQAEGTFIAGGAGITPFISVFRSLQLKNEIGNNKLIFANKTKADIILEKEFRSLLGNNFINVLSDESIDGYFNGYINKKILLSNVPDLKSHFYICGPPPMMDAIEKILNKLKVKNELIVIETF